MAKLTNDIARTYELGDIEEFPVLAGEKSVRVPLLALIPTVMPALCKLVISLGALLMKRQTIHLDRMVPGLFVLSIKELLSLRLLLALHKPMSAIIYTLQTTIRSQRQPVIL